MSKPLKKYEIINNMKKEILHMKLKFDKWESRVGKLQSQLAPLKEYHLEIENALVNTIKESEDTKAQIFDHLKNLKQELRTYNSPKAKPKVVKKVNEKVICNLCEVEFSKQGYPSHRKKCERIQELKRELSEELNEGEV